MTGIGRHDEEIQRNREAWRRKPRLREIYHAFYRVIGTWIDRSHTGAVVEIGSGLANIKDVIPECVTTDVFANDGVDRIENAYALAFADASISHLILFDVWHHLRYPGTALEEFHRTVAPGGRLILFEPAVSWLGRLVYGLFHHEPIAMREPITWTAPSAFSPHDADYYAAQGSATRLFWNGEAPRLAGWRIRTVRPMSSFRYLVTGGFSGPEIGGAWLFQAMRAVDCIADLFPRLFAVRLLVVLDRE